MRKKERGKEREMTGQRQEEKSERVCFEEREREREREIDSVSSHSKSHAICNRLNASVRSLSRPLLTDSLLPMSHEKFSAV